jgi:hypothetical protein
MTTTVLRHWESACVVCQQKVSGYDIDEPGRPLERFTEHDGELDPSHPAQPDETAIRVLSTKTTDPQ